MAAYLYEAPDRKSVMLTTGLFAAVGLILAFPDVAALAAPERTPYLVGRLACVAIFLTCFVLAYRHRIPRHVAIVLYATAILYGAHGQLFRPDYWFVPIEVNVLFPLFYFVRIEVLSGMYLAGGLLIDGIFLATAHRYVAAGVYSYEHVVNGVIMTVLISGIALLAYNNLIVLRLRKAQLFQRFFDLGKNFEYVMHDLKGMLSAPIVQAALVESGDLDAIHALREDMNEIRKYVLCTNQLLYGRPATEESRSLRISEAVDLVATLIRSRLKTIAIGCAGDLELTINPETINRVLINAMVNSVEAIMRTKMEHGKIALRMVGSAR